MIFGELQTGPSNRAAVDLHNQVVPLSRICRSWQNWESFARLVIPNVAHVAIAFSDLYSHLPGLHRPDCLRSVTIIVERSVRVLPVFDQVNNIKMMFPEIASQGLVNALVSKT